MANVFVNETSLQDIADAIRTKTGTQDTYKPAEMAEAIESISSGGITPAGTINITSNGTTDVTNYASANVNVPSVTPTGTKQISITQNGTTTEDVTNYANAEITVNVGGGTGIMTLIEQTTIALNEYTDTSTWETTDTQINVKNTDYAYILVVVTCDSAITTSTEWGVSLHLGGRYTSNGKLLGGATMQQKGTATLSYASMTSGTMKQDSYGVIVQGNTENITIQRKAHSSGCPKIRAGNYTVKVYGLNSL